MKKGDNNVLDSKYQFHNLECEIEINIPMIDDVAYDVASYLVSDSGNVSICEIESVGASGKGTEKEPAKLVIETRVPIRNLIKLEKAIEEAYEKARPKIFKILERRKKEAEEKVKKDARIKKAVDKWRKEKK